MDKNLRLQVILNGAGNLLGKLKGTQASAKVTSKEVKDLRDKLKSLDTLQNQISGFSKMKTDAAAASEKLKEARSNVTRLTQKMEAQQIAQNKIANETRSARKSYDSLAAAVKKLPEPPAYMLRNLQLQKAELDKLESSYAAARNRTRYLKVEMNRADQQVKATSEYNRKLSESLGDSVKKLKDAGVNVKGLAQHETKLKTEIDSTTASLKKQEAALELVNKRTAKMHAARAKYDKTIGNTNAIAGAGARTMAVGTAAGGMVAAPVLAYAKAEDSATQLQVAMMKKGGQVSAEYARINALATQLGNRLPGTTSDFQDMMTMLIRQGMTSKTILGGLGEATAYLGVQLKMPMDQAAEFAAKLQDATKTTEKDMMGLMDVIQKTFYLGVDQTNMLQGFAKLSPAMDTIKQKGLAGAQALAPLLVMADQTGMAGEAAGNAYRKVFQYALDLKKLGKANAALGGKATLDFSNGKGEFGGLDNLFAQLEKLKDLDTQTRLKVIKEMFGDDAETLQVVSLLIEKGKDGYQEVQRKMADQAALQDRVNKQLGTLKNLWDAASGTFVNALVVFGEAIAPELKAVVEWIGRMSEGLGSLAKDHPKLTNVLMKTIAVLAVLLVSLGGIAVAVAGIFGPFAMARFALTTLGINLGGTIGLLGRLGGAFNLLMRGIGMVGHILIWLGRALLMNPIGLAITAIATAAFLIYKYWSPIKTFFTGLWDGISAFFSTLPARFMAMGSQIMQGLVNGITSGLSAVKNAITGAGESAIGWFKEKLGIHSPSRVFAELGGFTMAGFDQGLNNGQGGILSTIAGISRKLAGAGAGLAFATAAPFAAALSVDSRPPIAASAPGAAGTSQIVINIYPAAGANPTDIAKQVAAELDRRERQKAANKRSSLTDWS